MLFTPEAFPSWSRRTADSTRFAVGAKYRLIPTPAITNGGTSRTYATVGEEIRASQASAADISPIPTTRSGRAPTRSESNPAIGATRIGMAVHGSVLRPASSGEYPWTTWKNCASRKTDPNIPKYTFVRGCARARGVSRRGRFARRARRQ